MGIFDRFNKLPQPSSEGEDGKERNINFEQIFADFQKKSDEEVKEIFENLLAYTTQGIRERDLSSKIKDTFPGVSERADFIKLKNGLERILTARQQVVNAVLETKVDTDIKTLISQAKKTLGMTKKNNESKILSISDTFNFDEFLNGMVVDTEPTLQAAQKEEKTYDGHTIVEAIRQKAKQENIELPEKLKTAMKTFENNFVAKHPEGVGESSAVDLINALFDKLKG